MDARKVAFTPDDVVEKIVGTCVVYVLDLRPDPRSSDAIVHALARGDQVSPMSHAFRDTHYKECGCVIHPHSVYVPNHDLDNWFLDGEKGILILTVEGVRVVLNPLHSRWGQDNYEVRIGPALTDAQVDAAMRRVRRRARLMCKDYRTTLSERLGKSCFLEMTQEFEDILLEASEVTKDEWGRLFMSLDEWGYVKTAHGDDDRCYAVVYNINRILGGSDGMINQMFVRRVTDIRVRGLVQDVVDAGGRLSLADEAARLHDSDKFVWPLAHIYAKAFAIESRVAIGYAALKNYRCAVVVNTCTEGFDGRTMSVHRDSQPAPLYSRVVQSDNAPWGDKVVVYDVIVDPALGGFVPSCLDHGDVSLLPCLEPVLTLRLDDP
jgi:hypothetical protein